MSLELLNILNTTAAFQLLLIIILLLHKGRNKLSNRFLAVFFIAQFMVYTNGLVYHHFHHFLAKAPFLALFGLPFRFLWGPCIFFYIISDHSVKFKLRTSHFLHFIPALAVLLFVLFAPYWINIETDWVILNPNSGQGRKMLNILMILQIIFYNGTAVYILEKNTGSWNFGNIDKSRIKWNKFILYGYIVACLLYNFTSLIYGFYQNTLVYLFLSGFIFFIYFNIIIYKALTSHHLFSFTPYYKTETAGQEEEDLKQRMQKLDEYILQEKPYLNFDLTVNELAQALNLSAPALSKLINQQKKQHFYDFINTYRIEEAKRLLKESEHPKRTVQEIMYACGYNSKSSFNTAFKKMTGETPSNFRKKHLKAPMA